MGAFNAILAAIFFIGGAFNSSSGDAACYHGWRAVDGDTFQNCATGERVRAIGYDAPELRQYGTRPIPECERALARDAAGMAERLIRRWPLEVERRATYPDGGRDPFGRTPAVVRVDSVDLAQIMIAAGRARPSAQRGRPWC